MQTSEIFEQLRLIKNPEQLKELYKLLEVLVSLRDRQVKHYKKLHDQQELAKQQFLSKDIETTFHRMKHTFFGFSREKSAAAADRLRRKTEKQLSLQAEGLGMNEESFKKTELPTNTIEHILSKEQMDEVIETSDLQAEKGDVIACIKVKDLYEESREITVTERTYTQTIHKRAKYTAENQRTGEQSIVTAPGPEKLYPKCQFSIDFAVMCVGDKFVNHIPYERQRREMNRSLLDVPVSTMCRLERGVSTHLETVYEKIKDDDIKAIKHLATGIDECKWIILNKKDSNGYFWVLSNAAGAYYRFEPTRSGKVARELLKDFEGAAISDKFRGYEQFLDKRKAENHSIDWAFCLAHARRDFISLQKHYPKECAAVLKILDEVFALEHTVSTYEELKTLRAEKSTPLMEDLKELLKELQLKYFKSDSMAVAINYLLSNYKEFTKFLTDTRIPLSNNESERAMRQAVLGRKNYRGSKTIDAADQAAIMFTIVETCKKNRLDPKTYMKYVITQNQKGLEALTPLRFVIEKYGKSNAWPENQKYAI